MQQFEALKITSTRVNGLDRKQSADSGQTGQTFKMELFLIILTIFPKLLVTFGSLELLFLFNKLQTPCI
jgi:hypothetical protein